jgi:capsular exopolysaccharide synthesis family protein
MANVHEALQRAEKERQQVPPGKTVAAKAPAPTSSNVIEKGGKRAKARDSVRNKKKRGLLEGGEANKRRIVMLQPESFVAEQFRGMRSRIDAVAAQRPMQTIIVTSAVAREGKSTSATNLALVSALSLDSKVLLIDCDMRAPQVATTFGITPSAGISEVLSGTATPEQAISHVEEANLDVLPVRTIPRNPSELLASTAMRDLLEKLSSTYDRIILDTPPVLGLPDVKILNGVCDGLVLVVRADKTPRVDIEMALEVIDGSKVLGMVLNGVPDVSDRYGYYGYGYGYGGK